MPERETGYARLSDKELLGILSTEEDRVSREAVDEFVQRGARMAPALAAICRDEASWTDVSEHARWKPVHATYILGAIGGEETLPALLDALRFSIRHDVDWVYEELPEILAALGPAVVPPLREFIADDQEDAFCRSVAIGGLGLRAARHAGEQDGILRFLMDLTRGGADVDVRTAAARSLLEAARPSDRAHLEEFARALERRFEVPEMSPGDVQERYAKGLRSRKQEHWLEFYDPAEIAERRRRSEEEREEARWSRGLQEGAPWVTSGREALITGFRNTLGDLDEKARGDACFIADSMAGYLTDYRRKPPWAWDPCNLGEFLLDHFPRKISIGDDALPTVPDHALRFIRFLESTGRVPEKARLEMEHRLPDLAPRFLSRARDRRNWGLAKSAFTAMQEDGVDLRDDSAREAWFARRGVRPMAPLEPQPVAPIRSEPRAGRNDPCPCGSGRKFKKCCGK